VQEAANNAPAHQCHSVSIQTNTFTVNITARACRYEKRHSNTPAHLSPCFRCKEGDNVVIGQCRPLSKTVRFNVLKVIPQGSAAQKKAFGTF
jgi:small subunit ribosomal protein S11e